MDEIDAAMQLCDKMENNVFYCPICEENDVEIDGNSPQLYTADENRTAKQCEHCKATFTITVRFGL